MRIQKLLTLSFLVMMILLSARCVRAQDTLDNFRNLINSGSLPAASLKANYDDTVRVVTALSTDKTFAGSVFQAVKAKDSATLVNLIKQRAPNSQISVVTLQSDFLFELKFGNTQTGNGFYLCLASKNNTTKCADNTRADIFWHYD